MSRFANTTRVLGVGALLTLGACSETQSETVEEPSPVRVDADGATLLQTAGGTVRVHALQIGTVAVKRCHETLCEPEDTTLIERVLAMLMDRAFQPPMPIFVYVIEHPEGVFVVDAGELSRFNSDPDYYACDPNDGKFDRGLLKVEVSPEEEVGPQLERLGIDPASVRGVVITHLHADHTGGVPYFPGVPVYVSQVDYELGPNGGFVTCRSLADAELRFFEQEPTVDDELTRVFGPSSALTSDGAIRLVPTPGHTAGSRSLMVDGLEVDLLFVGDAFFNEPMLTSEQLAGINADFDATRATYGKVKEWAEARPTVILPAHDWASPERLKQGATPPFGAPLP
jgi:N-acyl homoserine lactone hydrolase